MPQRDTRWWIENRSAQFTSFASADGRTAPLYRRLADGAAGDPEVLSLLDPAPEAQQRAVLLFASVHYLVLGDPGCDLARFYPSVSAEPAAADPWPTFRDFCLERRGEIEFLVAARSTQTNEVGRCAAVVPALQVVQAATGRPLSLVEVGPSAGLNLAFDRYRIEYSAPSVAVPPFPPFSPAQAVGPAESSVVVRSQVFGERSIPLDRSGSMPEVADRAGLDLSPVDVTDADAVRWLEACIFADRLDRLERLRAAVAVARADPPRVEQGDAVADLARVAAGIKGEGPLVVFHSWALTYVEDPKAFAAAVAGLAADRDVWWLSLEPSSVVPDLVVPARDARYASAMAANTVTALMHMTPSGRVDRVLARSHPHLDWLHWLD